jgi:PAS domain S-box-containing protein
MADDDKITNRLEGLFSNLPFVDPDGKAAGRPESAPDLTQPAAEALLLGPAFQAVASETLFAYLFQTTFENVAIGMSLIDPEGRLRRVNDAFCQLLGYTRAELEGVSFQSLAHPEDWKLGIKAMRELHTGVADTARVEMRWLRKDGRIAWVDLHFGLMLDAAGKPAFFTLAALDVSKLHETALELERLIQELSCLSDISQRIDQRPELEQFFEWIVEKAPEALLQPEMAIVAVEYQGRAYGEVDAMVNPARLTHDLLVNRELVGWLYVAYTDERPIAQAESMLVRAIGTLINCYLEIVWQQNQIGKQDNLLTTTETPSPEEIGMSLSEPVGEKPAGALRRLLRPRG